MPLLLALCLAAVQVQYPPRPAEGRFVVDLAQTIDAADEAEIERIAAETLREKRAPIHVVTLKSLADMGAAGWPIERYAMNLFAEWGIGWPDWNHGMLLVVSVGDRKARIELGAGWGHRKDEDAKRLMERKIVPEFKRGRMSAGAVEGAKGLRSIAMGLAAPPGGGNPLDDLPGARSCGRGGTWIIVVLVAIVLLSAVSRRGSSWGPGGLGGMSPGCGSFGSGCLGAALGNMIFGGFGSRGGGWGGGGGGWSGGSRGGGFSGGGGATGSW